MTEHIVQLPNPDGSLLLREWDHRINSELNSAIYAVSAKAVESDSVAVKAALLDVVDLLHQCADVHRALRMPDQGRLADAASYLQQLCFSIAKYRLDRLAIRVLFSADNLRLEGGRCWKLGLIVSELLTNVARHAQIGELASGLGGRVHTSCAADGCSFLLTFPLTEAEQRAAGVAHVLLKRRKMGHPQRLQASGNEILGAS